MLANLCAFQLDLRLDGLAHSFGARYSRYADDLVFSGPASLRAAFGRLEARVARAALEEGYQVNHRKTRLSGSAQRQQVCGVVIQSCLRRSEKDIEDLVERKVRVRLCKGAYLEPPTVAFPDKADVDRNYVTLMERLMEHGNYPGIATHDEKIITHAREFARRKSIPNERFEFQMLYGVRRDLQETLRKAGYNMRVYIPFGSQWYPYLMRRLAERPANIAFMLGNIMKESVRGR